MWSSIVVCAGISCRSYKQNSSFVSFLDYILERAGPHRRSPACADDFDIDSFFLPIDDVIDSFNRVLRRAVTAGVHKLQRHYSDLPVHASDAYIVAALRADDSGAMR